MMRQGKYSQDGAVSFIPRFSYRQLLASVACRDLSNNNLIGFLDETLQQLQFARTMYASKYLIRLVEFETAAKADRLTRPRNL
jgi:hypothetical protein